MFYQIARHEIGNNIKIFCCEQLLIYCHFSIVGQVWKICNCMENIVLLYILQNKKWLKIQQCESFSIILVIDVTKNHMIFNSSIVSFNAYKAEHFLVYITSISHFCIKEHFRIVTVYLLLFSELELNL